MRYVGVRFLLKYGSFLNVTVTETDAERLLQNVGKNEHQWGTINHKMFPPPVELYVPWAVIWSDVIAAHCFSLEQVPMQQQNKGKGTYTSGYSFN